MEFSGELSLWQQRVAEAPEGVSRRLAAFEALSPRPGGSFLDVGCGGGLLVRDLALAVGAEGRAAGLDPSADQLGWAQKTCEGLSQADVAQGDATAMAYEAGSFDGVASIHVLEYIADVDAALGEIRRVLKSGGKAALISVLWDHFQFHGPEAKLNGKMLEAWRAHCPHQMLPLDFPRKLSERGFAAINRRPLTVFNGDLHEHTAGFWISKLVARFALSQGVSEDETAAWQEQLKAADAEGRYAFVSLPMLTTATAV